MPTCMHRPLAGANPRRRGAPPGRNPAHGRRGAGPGAVGAGDQPKRSPSEPPIRGIGALAVGAGRVGGGADGGGGAADADGDGSAAAAGAPRHHRPHERAAHEEGAPPSAGSHDLEIAAHPLRTTCPWACARRSWRRPLPHPSRGSGLARFARLPCFVAVKFPPDRHVRAGCRWRPRFAGWRAAGPAPAAGRQRRALDRGAPPQSLAAGRAPALTPQARAFEHVRKGLVLVEKNGLPVAIGTVLGTDGRILTALSALAGATGADVLLTRDGNHGSRQGGPQRPGQTDLAPPRAAVG